MLEDGKDGLEEYLDIEREAHVVDVVHVHGQPVVPGQRVAAVSGGVAGDAGLDEQLLSFVPFVEQRLALEVRPRPDHAHVADEHVQELWHLVDARPAHERADLGHTRIVGAVVRGAVGHGEVGGVHLHRAELVHSERLAVFADARRVVEHRPLVLEVDERGHDGDEHEQKGQGDDADDDVEQTLDEVRVHQSPTSVVFRYASLNAAIA